MYFSYYHVYLYINLLILQCIKDTPVVSHPGSEEQLS